MAKCCGVKVWGELCCVQQKQLEKSFGAESKLILM